MAFFAEADPEKVSHYRGRILLSYGDDFPERVRSMYFTSWNQRGYSYSSVAPNRMNKATSMLRFSIIQSLPVLLRVVGAMLAVLLVQATPAQQDGDGLLWRARHCLARLRRG